MTQAIVVTLLGFSLASHCLGFGCQSSLFDGAAFTIRFLFRCALKELAKAFDCFGFLGVAIDLMFVFLVGGGER